MESISRDDKEVMVVGERMNLEKSSGRWISKLKEQNEEEGEVMVRRGEERRCGTERIMGSDHHTWRRRKGKGHEMTVS